MTIADIPPRLVPFPYQPCITGFLEALFRVHKRRIPTPTVSARHPHTSFEQMHGGFITHTAAYVHVIIMAVAGARTGVDEHDIEGCELMTDAFEFALYFEGTNDMAIRKVPEIQFH